MSELRANTISDAAGTGPVTLTGQSAAKAHYMFDHTTNTVVGSLNISGITDDGTGSLSPSFSNNFSEVDYSNASAAGRTVQGVNDNHAVGACTTSGTANQVRGDNALRDAKFVSAMHMGDLA